MAFGAQWLLETTQHADWTTAEAAAAWKNVTNFDGGCPALSTFLRLATHLTQSFDEEIRLSEQGPTAPAAPQGRRPAICWGRGE